MLKNLKSKLLLGVMVVAIMFVGAVALTAKTANAAPQAIVTVADIQYAATVKQGSSGQAALIWQRFLNGYSTTAQLVEDGAFGPLSAVQAKAWQSSKGLVADGVLGPMSRAVAMAQIQSGSPASAFPAGCTSTVGYSSVTGLPCATITTLPAGCTSTAGFSSTTGASCSSSVSLPAGCSSTAGFSPTTGASCSGAGSVFTGPLTGTVGTITVSDFTSGTETLLGEGKDENVLGVKVEADNGSDVSLSTMKVVIGTPTDTGSTRLERYIDGVDIFMGTTKVGSADVAEFSKDGTTYSKSIALSNVVIRKGESAKFYVAVNAKSVIDSDDIAKNWNVDVTDIRFQDAMGVITTESYTTEIAVANISFESSTASDAISTSSSSLSPSVTTLKVLDTGISDEYLAFAFKLKAGTNSSGLNVLEIPITVNPTTATNADNVISDIYLKVGSTVYDNYDLTGDIYTFTIDQGDLALDAGETAEVKVYATFMKEGIASTYTTGDSVTFSLDASTVVVENTEGDSVPTTSMTDRTGSLLTLNTNDVTVSGHTWTINSVGSLADFTFTVDAETEDFTVLLSSITNVDSDTGDATVATAELAQTPVASTVTINTAGVSYTVSAGTSATFRVRYAVTGANGTIAEITIPSVAGIAVPTAKQVSPTVTRNV